MANLGGRETTKLALTRDQVLAIEAPLLMLVGDRDPMKNLRVDPLHRVRPDWPVVVIPEAEHFNTVSRPEFIAGLVEWLAKNNSN